MSGNGHGGKPRPSLRLALECMAWVMTVSVVAGAAPAGAAPFAGHVPGHAAARPAVRQPARPAAPSVLMPCTPPRPAFNGGTGAFHTDHFLSDYVTAPTFGAADVPNANFTNVYLWPDPRSQTWDAHAGPLGAPPMALIDMNTRRLVCSSYFDLLTQYNINPPSFSGDENTVPTCVNGALASAALHKGVISWLGMGTFAKCIHDLNPNNRSDQVNIFLSPDLKASLFLHDGQDMCTHGASGYHGGFAGFPSWAVIATSPSCGKGLANITKIESHEMVELMSDTAGFGWKHDAGLDFDQTYNNGELADICSNKGEFSASPTNFPADAAGGPALVGPYWSDQDAQCEPQFIMNDTIVPMFSTPPFSFGGSNTTVTVPVSQNNDGVIQALELEVATGTHDLSGDARLRVTVHTTDGDLLPLPPVNEGTQWGSGTLHAVLLPNAVGVQVSHITGITLTEPDGSWDLAGISLQAAVVPPGPCTTPKRMVIDDQHETTQDDGKPAIMRMKGGASQTLTEPVTMLPAADTGLKLTGLDLVIGTGGDNLDGGRDPQDNANVVIHLASGRNVLIPNVNKTLEWPSTSDLGHPTSNPSPTIDLLSRASLPPSTVAGDVKSISIETSFPGGLSGENWDINLVQLAMSFGCARTGSPPTLKDITLLNLDGNNKLPDNSTGLCRETGSTHSCPQTIPAVPASEASDIVTNLRMTIVTGQDDLRCCNAPGNDANVVINSTNPASPMTYPNMNESQHLDNGVSFSFPLFKWTDPMNDPLPDPGGSTPLTLGQLQSVDIQTNFGGAQPDNWDIKKVVLTATVAVGGCCSHPLSFSALPVDWPDREKSAAMLAPGFPSLWVVKPSPNQPAVDNTLNGVSCAAPNRCVAVGSYGSQGGSTAMIETWNGSAWSIAPTPSLGSAFSTLTGVSCNTANNCLAVGLSAAGGSEGGAFQPLAEAWNGSKWKRVSPPASPNNAVFKSVSCPAASRCVAVGYRDKLDTARTLVETWHAGTWKVVPTPNRQGNNALEGVSCWAVGRCMAVGASGQAGVEHTLALKANGGPWHIVSTPDKDKSDNVLYATSCVGTGKCFAVGDYALATSTSAPLTRQTLVEAWNGSKWSLASSPSPGVQGDVLDGIACTRATNCVASGSAFDGRVQRALVVGWNGKKWKKISTPNPSATANVLFGVSCLTGANCDAVGMFSNGSGVGRTLVLRGS